MDVDSIIPVELDLVLNKVVEEGVDVTSGRTQMTLFEAMQ
jgi:hypothetical protein